MKTRLKGNRGPWMALRLQQEKITSLRPASPQERSGAREPVISAFDAFYITKTKQFNPALMWAATPRACLINHPQKTRRRGEGGETREGSGGGERETRRKRGRQGELSTSLINHSLAGMTPSDYLFAQSTQAITTNSLVAAGSICD